MSFWGHQYCVRDHTYNNYENLYWHAILFIGEDPKETSLKIELDRIREYMGRVKEIEDRDKRPRVETGAAKRFVRNALYQQPSDDHLPAAKKRKF